MKKIFLLLVSAFASATLMAQTSSVVVKLSQADGTPVSDVSLQAKKAKASAKSGADGIANINIAVKDELSVVDPRFYEVTVNLKNWNPADTINIPLTPVEGYAENASGENGEAGRYNSYGDIYAAIKAACPLVRVFGDCVVSNRTHDDSECALIVVDGKTDASLSEVVLSEVDKIEFLQTNQAAMYGVKAKYGALVISTLGATTKPLHKQ